MSYHIKHHSKRLAKHLKVHHKKYLFGVIWGWLTIKLVIFAITGFGISVGVSTHAEVQTGCYRTGEYSTGGYMTGGYFADQYLTGGYLTGGYTTGCYMEGQELTGGYLSGDQRYDQYLTGGHETGCYFTGEYLTGQELTGGYWTGEYLTGTYLTGGHYEGCITLVCDLADIAIVSPLSGSHVKDIFFIQWSYFNNDCLFIENIKQFKAQLLDHNNQRIDIATVPSTSTGVTFDSRLLSGIYNASGLLSSGLYTVTGTDSSGQIYNIFTGLYTGRYTNYATGYQIRIIDESENVFYDGENNPFIIDNQKPILSGITVSLNGVTGNFIGTNGTVRVLFVAYEELTGIVVNFRGTTANLVSKSGLQYIYSETLSTNNTEGYLNFSILYQDLAGNTGAYNATGPVIFDKTAPVISGFIISGDDLAGFTLSRKTLENSRYQLNYTIGGSAAQTVSGAAYLTSFNQLITGINVGDYCNFQISLFDVVGNQTQLSGKIQITTDGEVIFNYNIVGSSTYTGSVSTSNNSTGSLAAFAVTLQKEINKFNECKNAIDYQDISLKILNNNFDIRMPQFQKNYVKQIVEAFTVLVVTKLKENKDQTTEEFNAMTKRFNNFLVVLKLLRDDNNSCKQNLSNYHILQFQEILSELNISL